MSYCNESFYLDTSEFQALFLHGFGFIAIPIHLLGAYCILRKTPPAMKSVKWSLMNFHFWSCFLDFALSMLTTPYIILPAIAGYPLGVLNLFGIGVGEQIFFIFVTVGVLLVSMIIAFETRLLVIFNNHHWWHRLRIYCFLLDFILAFVYFIPLYMMIPDQSIMRETLIQSISCIPPYVDLNSVFLFSRIVGIPSIVVTLCVGFFMYQAFFFALLTGWMLNRQMKKSISINTINMQKKFLKALILQMVIPAGSLFFPAHFLVQAVWAKFHRQYVNNLCLIIMSSHGVTTTFVMLLIHAPYRNFLLDNLVFRTRTTVQKANSVHNLNTVMVTCT